MKQITQEVVDQILVEMNWPVNLPLVYLDNAMVFAENVEQHVFGNKILTKETIQEEWFYMQEVRADRRMIVFAVNLQRIIEQKFPPSATESPT